jgi:hypothetical protein
MLLGIAFLSAALLDWQSAHPGQPVPWFGARLQQALGDDTMENGILLPDLQAALGTLSGSLIVLFGLLPCLVGGLNRWRSAREAGAEGPRFPRMQRAAVWLQFAGGLAFTASFVLPGGPARSGWTAYLPPVETTPGRLRFDAQTLGLFGLLLLAAALLGFAINVLAAAASRQPTEHGRRRLPLSGFTQSLTAGVLVCALPVMSAIMLVQLSDNVFGSDLLPARVALWPNPLRWLTSPATVLLLLPAVGIALEIIGTGRSSAPRSAPPTTAWWFAAGSVGESVLAMLLGGWCVIGAFHRHAVGVFLDWQLPLHFAAGAALCAVFAGVYRRRSPGTGQAPDAFRGRVHGVLTLLYLNLWLLADALAMWWPPAGGAWANAARFHALWLLALAQAPFGVNWLNLRSNERTTKTTSPPTVLATPATSASRAAKQPGGLNVNSFVEPQLTRLCFRPTRCHES